MAELEGCCEAEVLVDVLDGVDAAGWLGVGVADAVAGEVDAGVDATGAGAAWVGAGSTEAGCADTAAAAVDGVAADVDDWLELPPPHAASRNGMAARSADNFMTRFKRN